MKQFRITKYNPKYRDALGVYTKKEWTSYSDIGKNVTKEEYETIETAYIETAIGFLKEQEIVELRVVGLEDHGKNIEAGFLSEEP
ncbi:MAG: hypothetical protein MPW14_07475 [Candidatus Manganitrophus sp.]|nr:hypothetical protein [Candidatus Manganitrophus sp.]MDC4222722.1 hypothetical protein [Candidatus Manganitrophus sp.]WDT71146.1 MAG: hypothetical protein MPW17_20815 [Candidatus Manganitrophus sp.]WDT81559.1 MAG: hypothetical protein MPW14_07475 [Candidatus Manganitrophus sp.]